MRRIFILVLVILNYLNGLGQSASRWKDMLSYYKVLHVDVAGDKIFAGGENAVFITSAEDGSTPQYEKYSSIQHVSSEPLSAVHYMNEGHLLFVSHINGKVEIIRLDDKEVIHDNGLKDAPIPTAHKKVLSVTDSAGIFYLAMPYGITEFKTEPLGFGNTYRIGPGGSALEVRDVKVFDHKIYAATWGKGVKYIDVDDPAKADPSRWSSAYIYGYWSTLFPMGNYLYGFMGWSLYKLAPGNVQHIMDLPRAPMTAVANEDYFFAAYPDKVVVYDRQFGQVAEISAATGFDYIIHDIQCNDRSVMLATKNHGVVQIDIPSLQRRERYPEGPLYNHPFATDAYAGSVWVVYGDYDQMYNPHPLDRYGVSHYAGGHWYNIPYDDFQIESLTDVKIDRQDTSQVFMGSFVRGLVKFKDQHLVQVYDSTNSTLVLGMDSHGNIVNEYRVSPLIFDDQHRLWMYEGLTDTAVHVLDVDRGSWRSYSFDNIMQLPYNEGAGDMDFDKDGHLWIATHKLGLVGLDPATGHLAVLNERNNIPYEGTYRNTQAVAVDQDNVMWIGTLRGLRILRQPSRAFSDPHVQTEPIIIELEELHGQDNQGVELMFAQEITEIVVDGSNNKWIGTSNAGVFYFSPDGQRTIYHFTSDNSPLPSNAIFDISIDPVTGMVYFSTDKGLIGFRGDATEGKDNLDKAYVYPNPLNQKRHERLIIRNLMSDISIKITDIEGNLVYETESKGGTVEWDLRNFSGQRVATGVYLILLTDKEHEHTKVLKALIVR